MPRSRRCRSWIPKRRSRCPERTALDGLPVSWRQGTIRHKVGSWASLVPSWRRPGGEAFPICLGDDLRLLFVGINPGLWTAAAQAHFAKRGNRFFPALHLAGLTDRVIDASAGFRPEDIDHLTSKGIGITNIVNQATARADELSQDELRRRRTRTWSTRSPNSSPWSW